MLTHRPYYILDANNQPVPVDDILEWGRFFAKADRHVAKTDINGVFISTVFLGIDHRLDDSGPPLLFETMVFGGVLNEYQWRYSSWDDALTGHKTAVRKVREANKISNRLRRLFGLKVNMES